MMSIPRGIAASLAALAMVVPIAGHAAETLAITNARIFPMGGAPMIEKGSILIRDGKVAAIGAEIQIPADARQLDAQGATVTPGFMLMGNEAGAVQFPMTPGYDDSASAGDLTAGFDVQYAIDPDSTYLPEIRRGGSTLALVTPSPYAPQRPHSYFGGQAAVLRLGVSSEMVTKAGVAVTLQLGPEATDGGRAVQIIQLKRVFNQLRTAREGAAPNIPGLSAEDVVALCEVSSGKIPLLVAANERTDILQALELAREYGLQIILDGAEEGWMVAKQIATAKIPVLVRTEAGAPSGIWGRTMANAARLDAAGVKVAIALNQGAAIFKFATARFEAGIAVAHGLPYDRALEALTSIPAEIFHIDDRFGSIAPGKQADIVLWTGDPLEPSTQVKTVMIAGIEQPLTSRKSLLRDKYLPQYLPRQMNGVE